MIGFQSTSEMNSKYTYNFDNKAMFLTLLSNNQYVYVIMVITKIDLNTLWDELTQIQSHTHISNFFFDTF